MTIARERLLDEISLKEARPMLAPARAGEALKKLKAIALDEAGRVDAETRFTLIAEHADRDFSDELIVVGVLLLDADAMAQLALWRTIDGRFGEYLNTMTPQRRVEVSGVLGFRVVGYDGRFG